MITVGQLRELAQSGESESLEFKATTGQRREAAKTICAMLNTRGGQVVFGVEPDGRVAGQQVGEQTTEDVSAELQEIEPPPLARIETVPIGDQRHVIVVSVHQGQSRPYAYKGKMYHRAGNTTVQMPRDAAETMLVERLHSEQRWENRVADDLRIDDLDVDEIHRTIDEAVRRGRHADPNTRVPLELLRALGLAKGDQLLRAAAVLFGRQSFIEARYPQCLVRLARFRGNDKSEFFDNRQFQANAFRSIRLAGRFLREHLPVAGRVIPGVYERQDDPLYPPTALREAIANAVCHRDYSIGGGSIAVAIFDDRLEVTSSGTLHFGLTVADLYREHESLPWNPLIARAFHSRGIVERWGRGTLEMLRLTKAAGLPPVEIEEAGGCVVVRFRPSGYTPPERVQRRITEHQRQLLALIHENQRVPLRQMREFQSDREDWEIKDDLATLKGLGLVTVEGHGRGAYWYRTEAADANDL